MTKVHLLTCGLILVTLGMELFSLPIEELTTTEAVELDLEPENSTVKPTLDIEMPCYLVRNDNGIIKTVNMSRAEAGNDTYTDYEELCPIPIATRKLQVGTLNSLLGG